ncbi:MAG: HDIG domain-containing metalloprotein, partial [Candidatus Woesearchaeota archaeon]
MINLPTKQECMHLIKVTYRMPQNIIDHSIQVNKVAVFLATKLKEKNIEINLDLVDRASILHDIMKMIEIDPIRGLIFPENKAFTISKKDRLIWMDMKKRYGHLTHEEAAYKIFKEKYPVMALKIKKHGYTNLEGENKLNTI